MRPSEWMACEHRFTESGFGLSDGRHAEGFVGVQNVRTCDLCDHVEVLVGGEWLDFDSYVIRFADAEPR